MSTADDTPNPDDPFEPSDDPEHLDDLSRELDDLVDFANLEREMTEAANTTPSGPYAGQSAGERKRMEPPVGRVASVVPGHFGDRLTVTEALASRGGGIGVVIEIVAHRHRVMEPAVRTLLHGESAWRRLLQHERRPQ